jgi:geranylgeranyl pyrophosphate synthase
MKDNIYERHGLRLAQIHKLMIEELVRWRSCEIEELWRVAHSQVQQRGKYLRPLLSLAIVDFFGGEHDLIINPAASVELYHMAALVLDDVQDNSEVRRGVPTVRSDSTASAAINVALFLRSVSYQLVHSYPGLSATSKLQLHRELDLAATWLISGQGIDVGWNEGWYASYREFPYNKMVEWKTGSLFGCAASMAACTCGADPPLITAVRKFGASFGALYQMVNDYLDVFGDGDILRRPVHEDFREGKMTGPVIRLLARLEEVGRKDDMSLVLSRLADRNSVATDWRWLIELMHEYDVARDLRSELSYRAEHLRLPSFAAVSGRSTNSLREIVDMIVTPAFAC